MLETATRGAVRFPHQVIALFTEAIHERNRFLRGEGSLEALQARRDEFDDRLLALARPSRSPAEYERLANNSVRHGV
jgi:transposase